MAARKKKCNQAVAKVLLFNDYARTFHGEGEGTSACARGRNAAKKKKVPSYGSASYVDQSGSQSDEERGPRVDSQTLISDIQSVKKRLSTKSLQGQGL